jgi:hypothetical protein
MNEHLVCTSVGLFVRFYSSNADQPFVTNHNVQHQSIE